MKKKWRQFKLTSEVYGLKNKITSSTKKTIQKRIESLRKIETKKKKKMEMNGKVEISEIWKSKVLGIK